MKNDKKVRDSTQNMLHHVKWAEVTHYRFLISCIGHSVSCNRRLAI
jgi:hypothetical protein